MNIRTLGTGSCTVNPNRYNSSVLIETRAGLLLFDAGSPVDALICRAGADICRLRAVFVTHMHADHVAGIATLIRCIIMSSGNVDIFLPESNAKPHLLAWMEAMYIDLDKVKSCVTFHVSQPSDNIYDRDGMCVSAIPTDHIHSSAAPITFSYTLCCDGKRILYTGDLSSDLHDYPACALDSRFDVCLMEATHYRPNVARALLEKSLFGTLILTHIHTPWQSTSGATELLREFSSLPYPVYLANDGDSFCL